MTPLQVLKERFGYNKFRFHQEEIITAVLSGKDVLAVMPTGGGKSICYQIPALLLPGLTLVVSPLISLMRDQVNQLKQFGIKAHSVHSGILPIERKDIYSALKANQIKILYVAPEGLFGSNLDPILKNLPISLIAIDEAHCISSWGHEFRSSYIRLGDLKKNFPRTPTIALTATADDRTRKDICQKLNMSSPNVFVSTFDRPNIQYTICERENELSQLKNFILKNHPNNTGIIYCLSRKKVERIQEKISNWGLPSIAYHAGLEKPLREENQKRFETEDHIIVVATIAFGMGINRPDVRFVAHLDLPKSIEGYYQETGRAGRDGQPSDAWMIYGLSDVVKLVQMVESSDADENYKKLARHKLDMMISLCETTSCRRQSLLSYFGENLPSPCGHCDTCISPPASKEVTIEAQKLLSTIYRTGQFFGSQYLIDILRGSKQESVYKNGHEKLSVYGIGKNLTRKEWNELTRELLTQGFIRIKNWDYRSLALTEKSRLILKGEHSFRVKKPSLKEIENKTTKPEISELEPLFQELRQLRKQIALDLGIPPYMVFSDRSLYDMCQILPRNQTEMMCVHGVGKNKFDRFGQIFLKKICQYESDS